MENLIGAGKVNQIIGRFGPNYVNSATLSDVLAKAGVAAVGRDGSGNITWFESRVKESVDLIHKELSAREEPKIEAPKKAAVQEMPDAGKHGLGAYVCEIEELRKDVGVIKTQNQAIHGKLSSEFAILKDKHRQEHPNNHEIDGAGLEKIINELAGFIGSYMADQQRILTQQIDSALQSIDSKTEQINKSMVGLTRINGEAKATIAEINRQQQSLLSNVYTTQKATREELVKQMARTEQAIDQLREDVTPRLQRIDSATNRLSK